MIINVQNFILDSLVIFQMIIVKSKQKEILNRKVIFVLPCTDQHPMLGFGKYDYQKNFL